LSQKETAKLLRVTDDTLRNWESGSTVPREESLAALAQFCEVPFADLFGAPVESRPVRTEAQLRAETGIHPPAPGANRKMQIALALTGVLLVVIAVRALLVHRQATSFYEMKPVANGVAAISRSGKVLWQTMGIDPIVANRWAMVRMPGGTKMIACVLSRPGDFSLETVSVLSFIDPDASQFHILKTVRLPATADFFPDYSRRYELAYINALDLDGDGIDEILATYQQVPECVSFTVLYEPRNDHARVIFVQTGAHHFTGAYDIDGDGRRDLLFLGINNGYNWVNALSAVRVDPWIGSVSRHDDGPLFSPDSIKYLPNESELLFYALLPRGGVPDEPRAVEWDGKQRVVSVRLLNGRTVKLTPNGFPVDGRSSIQEQQRDQFRRQAYQHDRESRRLLLADRAPEAVAESQAAVAAAGHSAEAILDETMQRGLGKALIAAGQTQEGEGLLRGLAVHSENASEIYYEAAAAFHLRGDLDRAVAFYEMGIGRGGSPEAGKDKHEFIQGEVLALVERKAWPEALAAIQRFRERYGAPRDIPMYEEYVRWRHGEMPRPERVSVWVNATDLQRYWMLEFRNARGDDAKTLLSPLKTLLAERNQPIGAILSLQGVLLSRLGSVIEAAKVIVEARQLAQKQATISLIARGHLGLVRNRCDAIHPRLLPALCLLAPQPSPGRVR
jgi:Flp pilus assembly protein TadD